MVLQSLQEHDLRSLQMLSYNDITLKCTLHATYSCSQVACPKYRSRPGWRQVQDKHQRQSPRLSRSFPGIVVPTPELSLLKCPLSKPRHWQAPSLQQKNPCPHTTVLLYSKATRKSVPQRMEHTRMMTWRHKKKYFLHLENANVCQSGWAARYSIKKIYIYTIVVNGVSARCAP